MKYTVLGLINNDSDELMIAGVVEGDIDCVDTDQGGYHSRWASSFDADSPDEAEEMAHEEVANR